jgi:hypothetical protein
MSGTELKARWRVALDAADAAVEAGRRAHELPPEDCRAELQRLRLERQWLERLRWP